MRRHGLTPKIPQKVHINRAGKEAVLGWQYRFDKRVSRLEGDGFTIVDEDEAFFIHDVISGRKYWSPRGEKIVVPYTGKPQEDRGLRGHRQGRQAVLQDTREL